MVSSESRVFRFLNGILFYDDRDIPFVLAVSPGAERDYSTMQPAGCAVLGLSDGETLTVTAPENMPLRECVDPSNWKTAASFPIKTGSEPPRSEGR
jgi:hypothetical protein